MNIPVNLEHMWRAKSLSESTLLQGWEQIFSKDQTFTKSDFFIKLSTYLDKYFTYYLQLSDVDNNAHYWDWILKSREFYEKLSDFLRNRVHHILTLGEHERDDGDVLRFYAREWNEYQHKAKILDDACCSAYRLRSYDEVPDERSNIIYKLAVIRWREHQFHTRVAKAVLNLIERERNGDESPDIHLIKDVLSCLTEDAGRIITDEDLGRCRYYSSIWGSYADDFREYRNLFQSQFLRDTEIFYASKCPAEFSNVDGSCTEYIKFVERTLRIENDRIRRYLPKCTGWKSMSICRAELMMMTKHPDNGSQSEGTVKRQSMQVPAEVVSTIGKFIDSLFTKWGIQEEKSWPPTY